MNNWLIRQVDINNVFLNGILIEDVYMAQPEGFIDSSKPHYVWKVNKAFCGFKQAPRAWFDIFKATMIFQWSFVHCKSNSLFFYKCDNRHILLVLVYVDDIIITGSSSQNVLQLISDMQTTSAQQLSISYILSVDQNADVLTKAFTYGQFNYLWSKLNVLPEPFSLMGDISICSETESTWAWEALLHTHIAGNRLIDLARVSYSVQSCS